jgi:hypothetical protein
MSASTGQQSNFYTPQVETRCKMKKVAMELVAIGLVVLGIFLFFPVPTMLLTFVVAGGAYLITKSQTAALGILLAAAALHTFNVIMKPTPVVPVYSTPAKGAPFKEGFQEQQEEEESTEGFQQQQEEEEDGIEGFQVSNREGFQPRDPISIHQRITANKTAGPLKPKSSGVTGVLESPSILSSYEIRTVAPEERGAAARTMPAAVKENFRIRTVEEGTMPQRDSDTKPIMEPFLNNGADEEGEEMALLRKGTDANVMPAGDLEALPGV